VPAVYQLLGFPGTGKLTIAREIVAVLEERGEPAALLDNHATANLVWSLVPIERRFEPEVMGTINELRRVLMTAARSITGPTHSLVLTNFVPAAQPGSVLDPHRALALALARPLIAVVLRCDREEVLRRVVSPERERNLKLGDADVAARIMDAGMSLPDWPELVDLDITGLTAREAALRVVAMADAAGG
jgi:hypothetical protein